MAHIEDYRQPEQYSQVAPGPDALTEPTAIVAVATKLLSLRDEEKIRLEKIDHWYKGTQDPYRIPHPTEELNGLLQLSRTPWLGLVVTTLAQAMFVDGFRSDKTGHTVDESWNTWVANGLPSRQVAVHRAALGYGYAFMLIEAGTARDGTPRSVMRGLSPKRCYALYNDPAWDEYPQYAIQVAPVDAGTDIVYLWDETYKHKMVVSGVTNWKILESLPHGAGVVPIVRFTNSLDLEGGTPGEVEPFIPMAQRVDKTSFDRLLTQHYNSWKKLYIAGLKKPNNEDDARVAKLRLRQDDILIAEDAETKFGAIPETDLMGFIQSVASDVEHLASMAQLPNHLFTGKLVNLSADAIVAANKPLTQKVYERQVSFGQSHNQALRLAAFLEGNLEAAEDLGAHVTWQDMEIRSLAQAADALGKMATQLGVPRKALWRMVPSITKQDTDEWEEMLLDDDPESKFLRDLDLRAKANQATAKDAPLDQVDTQTDAGPSKEPSKA